MKTNLSILGGIVGLFASYLFAPNLFGLFRPGLKEFINDGLEGNGNTGVIVACAAIGLAIGFAIGLIVESFTKPHALQLPNHDRLDTGEIEPDCDTQMPRDDSVLP